jgi:putative ABC transport system permease protein
MTIADIATACSLVLSFCRQRPARLMLTILATVASAAIVVAVVSSYDSLLGKFAEFTGDYLGRYDFIALPVAAERANPFGSSAPPLPAEVFAQLKADPAVAAVDGVHQSRPRIAKVGAEDESPARRPGFGKKGGKKGGEAAPAAGESPPAVPAGEQPEGAETAVPFPGFMRGGTTLVATEAEEAPYSMIEGRWFTRNGPAEGVMSRGAAQQLKVQVGDEVVVAGKSEPIKVAIVGIIEQRKSLPQAGVIIGLPSAKSPPLTRGPATAALYVPMAIGEKTAGNSARTDFAALVLKRGASIEEFRSRWEKKLAEGKPAVELMSLAEIGAELDNSSTSDSVRNQAYSATGISLLAALFIILTTLSMGVDERVRQFAVLRAVAFTKSQIAVMIVFEALLLGLIGWGGGLLAGWAVLEGVRALKPDLFPVGTSLGAMCVGLSGACALGGSLVASIMPAWRATRISPLDAMSSATATRSNGISWLLAFLGLLLIAVHPICAFLVPMPDTYRYAVAAFVGCPAMAIGFVLLAPATILVVERVLGPAIAQLLGLDPLFLAEHLSSNLWRTLGTTVSLTLGLGLFVAMQVWGYSMLKPFFPGDWAPEFVVAVNGGMPESQLDAVRKIPGVVPDQVVPMVSEQMKFAADYTGAKIRTSASRQDNCVMIGVDPDLAFGGAKPTFPFRFVQGSMAEALAKLKTGGRYCLVPDHFARESGLRIGDKFGVVSRKSGKIIEYEIIGIVSMDGWHWISKFGIRTGGGRSAGLMFAPMVPVREDFDLGNPAFWWMNLDGAANVDDIKSAFQKIAADNTDTAAAKPARGGGRSFGRQGSPVRTQLTADVRKTMLQRTDGILWILSQMPLVTLLVTSLGVMNTVISSVRARRWEMGILRAVGVTRFGLFRMVLAEAFLIGVVACALSLAFGVLAGYTTTEITRYTNLRGGLFVGLVVPWGKISLGFAATLGLCLLAAMIPAIGAGRTQPLRLLQAGRSAT